MMYILPILELKNIKPKYSLNNFLINSLINYVLFVTVWSEERERE
jgi:hypothetical protein